MAHFKYRIERTKYRTLPESADWDDEPTPPEKEIVWEGEKDRMVTGEHFRKQKVHTWGGWVSFSFELQLFNPENNEWEFVNFLKYEDWETEDEE